MAHDVECRRACRSRRMRVVCLVTLGLLVAASSLACSSSRWVQMRQQPNNPLSERLQLLARGGPKPTARTLQLLRRQDLNSDFESNPRALMAKLHELASREPSPEHTYAMAELAYLGGKKMESQGDSTALDLYGAAVTNAYMYLFDSRFDRIRNPYDPQYRGASEIYNTALESALRHVRKKGVLRPGCTHTIRSAGQDMDVTVEVRSPGWKAEDFDRFEFASDYQASGLNNEHRSYGLGVPLIAIRKSHESTAGAEPYYPPSLSFPVTAFLRITNMSRDQQAGRTGRMQAVLELYDPLVTSDVQVVGRWVPLQTDLTTPLAYFLNQPQFDDTNLSTLGLLRPDKAAGLRGLYMLEPFQAHKIPVIMVHGLWSSPVTWMQMYNDLRADPEIRRDYQFWFYLYPTGQPFWVSAREMRTDIAQMRNHLDPMLHYTALSQSVLIGHSMGGLISRLQTIDSGSEFWKIVSDQPFEQLKAEPEVRNVLAGLFFVKPDVSVRRVITIGTPHGGSHFANNVTRWFGNKLISLPGQFLARRQRLLRDNPGFFHETELLSVNTSIDSLSPNSKLLPVLRKQPPAPWIQYHNIIGHVRRNSVLARFSKAGDGVVSLASANLDSAKSQIVVEADHSTIHQQPRAILEVRRILFEHLHVLRNQSPETIYDDLVQPVGAAQNEAANRPPTDSRPHRQMPLDAPLGVRYLPSAN